MTQTLNYNCLICAHISTNIILTYISPPRKHISFKIYLLGFSACLYEPLRLYTTVCFQDKGKTGQGVVVVLSDSAKHVQCSCTE